MLALTVMLNVGNVYAQTLTLTPNPVTQGVNVVATGSGFNPNLSSSNALLVAVNAGVGCSGPTLNLAGSTDGTGNLNPITIPTSGLSVGVHCMEVNPAFGSSLVSANLTVNSATSIPEYPFGLAVLAIFMMLAYGVIRRKTRYD